ncbi:MAG TPA: helix-turn-helix domain-containing protein [Nitrospiria bacterium]|nr:helix-turn-helix domain-containing protein [Nitrospiria bacterium]
MEKKMILGALKEAGGVQSRAAQRLKISERILRYKMKKYGMEIHTKMSDRNKIVEIRVPFKKQ